MHKIRLTGYQTISILKSVKAGRTVKDICSKAIFRLHVITAGRRNMAECIGDPGADRDGRTLSALRL